MTDERINYEAAVVVARDLAAREGRRLGVRNLARAFLAMKEDVDLMRVALESIADSLDGHPAATATEADMDEWHLLAEQALTAGVTPRPVVTESRVIAGALFDFAAYLTTMDEVYEVGASRDSTRMVAELRRWAKRRGLDLSDADMMDWQGKVATPRPVVSDRVQEALDDGGMTGAWLVINAAEGRVMGDCDSEAEAADLCAMLQEGDRQMFFVAARPAAVRSDTLAEVRRAVAALALDWPTLFTTADGTEYVRHTAILAALDRMEATDGPS